MRDQKRVVLVVVVDGTDGGRVMAGWPSDSHLNANPDHSSGSPPGANGQIREDKRTSQASLQSWGLTEFNLNVDKLQKKKKKNVCSILANDPEM